jgi:hypothetical protein
MSKKASARQPLFLCGRAAPVGYERHGPRGPLDSGHRYRAVRRASEPAAVHPALRRGDARPGIGRLAQRSSRAGADGGRRSDTPKTGRRRGRGTAGFKERAENRWTARVAAQTALPTATVRTARGDSASRRGCGRLSSAGRLCLLTLSRPRSGYRGHPSVKLGLFTTSSARYRRSCGCAARGRRARSGAGGIEVLSMELQHWGEIIPTDTNGCVLRVTTMTAALGTEEESRAEAQRGVDQYVTRVHNLRVRVRAPAQCRFRGTGVLTGPGGRRVGRWAARRAGGSRGTA